MGDTAQRGWVVCQLGARMHYAVPRLLHAAGELRRFYTDLCAQKGWPRVLSLIPESLQPAAVRRLTGRQVHGVPAHRIRAFTAFGLEYARRRAAARDAGELDETFLWAGRTFCNLVAAHLHAHGSGPGAAAGIYAFNTAGLELLELARDRGIRGVVEQTIAPRERELCWLRHEREKHPAWESESALTPESTFAADASATALTERERREWAAAGLILCGSQFVRDEIAACGGPVERCVVVEYGVDEAVFGLTYGRRELRTDSPLRVLTVGAVGLRKGSPYVLAAARGLGRRRAVFRMVGPTTGVSADVLRELSAHVELCGAVPRSEIARHFAWADVFLLPSVCEGSATVTYESLAAGLPVIATPNTGSVVREGWDGFLVPCGDSESIAERIERLAADRGLLEDMAGNAREHSREFTLRAYGDRLRQALRR